MTAKTPETDAFSSNRRVSETGDTQYEHITSTANPSIKLLRSLDRKKTRNDTGWFLAEGGRLVREGLAHGWTPRLLCVGADALARPQTREIVEEAERKGARILSTTAKVLGAVARKDNPQTLLAAFEQKLTALEDISTDGSRRFIALYEVRDPGNLGTILRTADAAGVDAVILVNNCCDPFSVESVRATMGSLFSMTLAQTDFDTFNTWRKSIDASMTAASINGTQRHDAVDYGPRSIILMGNEQAGLPPEAEAACDHLVRIPMAGAADSLNLAQATAIMTYEVWKGTGYDGADR